MHLSGFKRWCRSTATIQNGFGKCFRKCSYGSVEIAKEVRAKCEERTPGLKLYIYECSVCKKFHLTKQVQQKEIT